MNFSKHLLGFAIATTLSSTALALPNGKPFQELSEAVSTNADAISANQDAIAALQQNIASIDAQIATINATLTDLDTRISANTAGIDAAMDLISTNANDIEALQDELVTLRGDLEFEIEQLSIDLNDRLDSEIAVLVSANEALAGDLAQAVLDLTNAIAAGDQAVTDALNTQVTLLSAQVTANTSRISSLEAWKASVATQISTNTARIASLETELDALKQLVHTYHDPCLDSIDFGQTVAGEMINDGECTADSRGNGAYPARYYTFDVTYTRTVTIEMNGSACGGANTLRDPYLYLHSGGRDGAVITLNDDGGCGLNSRIVRTLTPGTYTIESTVYSSWNPTGTFSLRLY